MTKDQMRSLAQHVEGAGHLRALEIAALVHLGLERGALLSSMKTLSSPASVKSTIVTKKVALAIRSSCFGRQIGEVQASSVPPRQ